MKLFLHRLKINTRNAAQNVAIVMLAIPLWKLLMQYSEVVHGVNDKTGQQYYKYITDVNGVQHYKPKGLVNLLVKWHPVTRPPLPFIDLDIASLYPNMIDTTNNIKDLQ